MEIVRDQVPHLLRLEVVRIVVTGGQHVRTGHDAALDLSAEAFAAAATIKIQEILRIFGTTPETHAIESRQVRGTLSRGHHVVGWYGQVEVRHVDLGQYGAVRFEHCKRFANRCAGSLIQTLIEMLAHYAYTQSFD